MNEPIFEKLQAIASFLQWMEKHDEARVIDAFAVWLQTNGARTRQEAEELLRVANNNPILLEEQP